MSILSTIFGPSREQRQVQVMDTIHETTLRQIEEAKAAVAEVGLLKDSLVERANGAVYNMRKRGGGHGEGESSS